MNISNKRVLSETPHTNAGLNTLSPAQPPRPSDSEFIPAVRERTANRSGLRVITITLMAARLLPPSPHRGLILLASTLQFFKDSLRARIALR